MHICALQQLEKHKLHSRRKISVNITRSSKKILFCTGYCYIAHVAHVNIAFGVGVIGQLVFKSYSKLLITVLLHMFTFAVMSFDLIEA